MINKFQFHFIIEIFIKLLKYMKFMKQNNIFLHWNGGTITVNSYYPFPHLYQFSCALYIISNSKYVFVARSNWK